MANHSSIARPYAIAAFEIARDNDQLATWKAFLKTAKQIALDSTVAKLLANPEITASKNILDLFEGVLQSLLNTQQKNFLLLLVQNKRLMVLPDIAEQFDAYCAQLGKSGNVRVITAVEVDDAFKQKLVQALTKRTQQAVTLQCEVNPSILGGAIVHIGDRVIDGSIRGKLTRLLEFSLR